jgi:hypothetical protein
MQLEEKKEQERHNRRERRREESEGHVYGTKEDGGKVEENGRKRDKG